MSNMFFNLEKNFNETIFPPNPLEYLILHYFLQSSLDSRAINNINFSSVTFDPDAATLGVTNIGTAPMQNGIAFIPVTFTSSDPKSIKLALKHKGLKIDSSASIGSLKPDPRVKPRFIVVVVAYLISKR